MRDNDVIVAAPDARGVPFAADYVVGVVSGRTLEKELDVRYEQVPWQPKQGGAAVHPTSIKIGTWELDADRTSFRVNVAPDAHELVQPLLGDRSEDFIAQLPARAIILCKEAVIGHHTKRRRTQVVDLERETSMPPATLLGVKVAEQQQARLVLVKSELVDVQDDMQLVVMQNDVHKTEIDELRALALKHGATPAQIEEIKIKHQRRAASSRPQPGSSTNTAPSPAPGAPTSVPAPVPAPALAPAFASTCSLSVRAAAARSVPTRVPPAKRAAQSKPEPEPEPKPKPKTYEEFARAGLYHINSLKTEESWAPNENVAFIPFLAEQAASPYFGSGEQDYVTAVQKYRSLSEAEQATRCVSTYKEVRAMLVKHGYYGDNICTQLATWLVKVKPGDYLMMRHNAQQYIFNKAPEKSRRRLYAIGRVQSTPPPGSPDAHAIAQRLQQHFSKHPGYHDPSMGSIYGPSQGSEEYTVEWLRLGFTDDLSVACPEFQGYIGGQQTKTFSDQLCRPNDPDADKSARNRKIRSAIWDSATVDIAADGANSEAELLRIMRASPSALVVD